MEGTGDGLFSRYCLGILVRITPRENLMMVGVCQDWNQAPPKSAVLQPEPVFSFIICAHKLKVVSLFCNNCNNCTCVRSYRGVRI